MIPTRPTLIAAVALISVCVWASQDPPAASPAEASTTATPEPLRRSPSPPIVGPDLAAERQILRLVRGSPTSR